MDNFTDEINQKDVVIELGDFIQLHDGKTYFISNRDDKDRLTLETANKFLAAGAIATKTVYIDSDEVFINIKKGIN